MAFTCNTENGLLRMVGHLNSFNLFHCYSSVESSETFRAFDILLQINFRNDKIKFLKSWKLLALN